MRSQIYQMITYVPSKGASRYLIPFSIHRVWGTPFPSRHNYNIPFITADQACNYRTEDTEREARKQEEMEARRKKAIKKGFTANSINFLLSGTGVSGSSVSSSLIVHFVKTSSVADSLHSHSSLPNRTGPKLIMMALRLLFRYVLMMFQLSHLPSCDDSLTKSSIRNDSNNRMDLCR